jgi:hypothetical protein
MILEVFGVSPLGVDCHDVARSYGGARVSYRPRALLTCQLPVCTYGTWMICFWLSFKCLQRAFVITLRGTFRLSSNWCGSRVLARARLQIVTSSQEQQSSPSTRYVFMSQPCTVLPTAVSACGVSDWLHVQVVRRHELPDQSFVVHSLCQVAAIKSEISE